MRIIVKNLRYPITVSEAEVLEGAKKRLGVPKDSKAAIHKRSIDARRRAGHGLEFVYSVTVECELSSKRLEKLQASDFEVVKSEKLSFERGKERLNGRPLVVGFGPCGMFAALLLAENGYSPIVIERGGDIDERQAAVKRFNETGILDTSTNIQFGAGGAGTFSDGKLVTRINDPRCSYVLERFYEFGAPEEILTLAKPHVGTDKLVGVVSKIKERIISLGGEIRFNTKLSDLVMGSGNVKSVVLEDKGGKYDMEVGAVILAVGHSARDTYDMLASRGIGLVPKPFSVGVRVEHLQSDIDKMLYGSDAGKYDRKTLPPGEYNLSYREKQSGLVSDSARGVYSFCMCPGGEVVAAASEEYGVVTNGMSRYARDGRNANSAIAVSVFPEDIGGNWRSGIEFQRELERRAYSAGGGNYRAPVELLGDFLEGREKELHMPKRITPTYREGSDGINICRIDKVLPEFVTDMLRKGFHEFAKKMKGFDAPDAILTGVETRTSSPIRIPRVDGRAAGNLYPCGEGAGYAGGITSAAVDGVNTAICLMSTYNGIATD